jgi:two-component system nitrogen regulation sensor histidine kinase NtrY
MLPNNDLVKDPRRLQFFLLADVIFVILLISIIIRQIVLILVRRRKSYDESRLYIKFVNLFAAMALGPAIGLVIITSLFFNLELRTWYGDAVRDAVVNSNIVARNYENEIQAEIVSDTQLIMREILKVSQNNEVNIQSIRSALSEFINLRTISSIYIFNTEGNIYLSLKDPDNKNFSVPSNEIFKIVNQNRVYIFQLNKNSITAYKKINFLNDVYMQVNRNLNTNIWDHISATKEAFEIYTTKEEESSGIQITYSMIFVLFSICFILVAILIGFNLASNLSKPITNLIKSANKISEGNFDAKVPEVKTDKDLEILNKNFNLMIDRLKTQQEKLIINERHEAWGSLARKLAHEIKNPLTPIQLTIDRLREKYSNLLKEKDSENFKDNLKIINNQIKQIGNLVNEFSDFARMPKPTLRENNLVHLLKENIKLLKELDNSIVIDLSSNSEKIILNSDKEQISRVFLNLIKNSIESIQQKVENDSNFNKKITIELTENDGHIKLIIVDNGIGFGKFSENIKDILNPYFTTKKNGTGLGLSIVNKIINDHNGKIEFIPRNDGAEIKINFIK